MMRKSKMKIEPFLLYDAPDFKEQIRYLRVEMPDEVEWFAWNRYNYPMKFEKIRDSLRIYALNKMYENL